VKLVLKHNKFFVESKDKGLLKKLMNDPVVKECIKKEELIATTALKDQTAAEIAGEDIFEPNIDKYIDKVADTSAPPAGDGLDTEQAHSFEINPSMVTPALSSSRTFLSRLRE